MSAPVDVDELRHLARLKRYAPIHLCLTDRWEPWRGRRQVEGPSAVFRRCVLNHTPDGFPFISSKDLRKSFSTLLEIDLGANGTALGFYLGHAGGVRHRHYTARDLKFLRREVAEKVEGWLHQPDSPLSTQSRNVRFFRG